MNEYEYEQELVRRYQAEVLGEAYFNPLMMDLGMDVTEPEESRRAGISMAEEMRGKN